MKTTTVLHAINHIIDRNLYNLNQYQTLNYKIRINNTGEALESLVKDALCNNFESDLIEKLELQSKYLSYSGNQNNPPDLIIKNGDALEIKKIGTNEGNIALNSSFPKDRLYRNSPMITNACRNCEDGWEEKDICYIIGCIDNEKNIKSIWFVYGDCYCATYDVYSKIKDKITDGIQEIGIELAKTNEIAKIKKIDPLGITDLRVRGMWGIENPSKVFSYITKKTTKPYIKALMLKKKFESFDSEIKNSLSKKCNIQDVKIKNPNNPANLLDAVLIEHEFETPPHTNILSAL